MSTITAGSLFNREQLDREIDRIKSDTTLSLTDPSDSLSELEQLRDDAISVQQKVEQGLAAPIDADDAAHRLALLKLSGDVIANINAELGGQSPVPASPTTADSQWRGTTQPAGARVRDQGYGADAAVQRNSVRTDPSNLTEAYKVIKTKEDIASGMNHNAVELDVEPDEELIKAYYELVNSMNDRIEDTYEDQKELDIQTGENTPPIKIKVLGYCKSPQVKAAKTQEDATSTSGALPPTDNIPGYSESYMKHSTANPKRFG